MLTWHRSHYAKCLCYGAVRSGYECLCHGAVRCYRLGRDKIVLTRHRSHYAKCPWYGAVRFVDECLWYGTVRRGAGHISDRFRRGAGHYFADFGSAPARLRSGE